MHSTFHKSINTVKYSANLANCIEDFYGNVEGNDYIARSVLQELTGVSSNTISRWMRGIHEPSGVNRRAVIFVLESIGYSISEFQDVSDTVRDYGLLIVFGDKTVREVKCKLSLRNQQEVGELLLGRKHVPQEEMKVMEREVRQDKAGLVSKKREIQDRLPSISGSKIAMSADDLMKDSQTRNEQSSQSELSDEVKEEIITAFVSQAESLKTLAGLVLSDRFSGHDRQEIRDRFQDGSGVFNLSNLLKQLCSETARDKFE